MAALQHSRNLNVKMDDKEFQFVVHLHLSEKLHYFPFGKKICNLHDCIHYFFSWFLAALSYMGESWSLVQDATSGSH